MKDNYFMFKLIFILSRGATNKHFNPDILQVKTHFARPDWKEVFAKIAKKHPYSTIGKLLQFLINLSFKFVKKIQIFSENNIP